MAKKPTGRSARRRGGARGRKFSVKALHRELDKVLKRLRKQKTTSAKALHAKISQMRKVDTRCPRTMALDLSQ